MRSPVTAIIQAFNALTEDQQKLCLDFIAPEPEPPAKQAGKKRTRSSRPGLPETITKAVQADAEIDKGAVTLPVKVLPNCGICGNPEDHPDHDRSYLKSHDFEPPKSSASASKRSGRKGAGTSSTANTGGETENATAVAASAGD